jgi:hypothetical protein
MILKKIYVPNISQINNIDTLFETQSITDNNSIHQRKTNNGICQCKKKNNLIDITNLPQLLHNITNVPGQIIDDNQISGLKTNHILNFNNNMYIDYPQLLCGNNPSRQSYFVRSLPFYKVCNYNCGC